MYNYIKQYADTFDIPLKYAFGVANTETGYDGPFHWKYNPSQTSSAGAVGPMQIMPSSASYFNEGVRPSRDELKTDIDLNVKISMRMLGYLKNKYGRWDLALGAYNTGKPCVNGYASRIVNGWLYGNNTQKIIRVH
jgi:soluble lytic murein transglycosylase-like protein